MEVWYLTATEPSTGAGVWVHAETVAPHDGGDAYGHGWAAVFPTDAAPAVARFGPGPLEEAGEPWFSAAGAVMAPGRTIGKGEDDSEWDLSFADDSPPLWTFSQRAWEKELLPGAQIVPAPSAAVTGHVRVGDTTVELADGRGALARIYGHGSAERWAWLHADLGDGDVLEIVAAVSRQPVLRRLPPRAAVQLRVGGEDWPANPLLGLARMGARVDLPTWTVRGVSGRQRIRVEVHQPPDRCVTLGYVDPDGATATCTNTERADATVALDRWSGGQWVEERRWELDGTAHAEVGTRP